MLAEQIKKIHDDGVRSASERTHNGEDPYSLRISAIDQITFYSGMIHYLDNKEDYDREDIN